VIFMELFQISPGSCVREILNAVLPTRRTQSQSRGYGDRSLLQWGAKYRKGATFFGDGSWHSRREIEQALGVDFAAIVAVLQTAGFSFAKRGADWRMCPRGDSTHAHGRGRIFELPPPAKANRQR